MSIHAQLFGSILTDQVHPDLDTNFPFIPLMTPGIPLPGPNFARQAQRLDPANQAPIEGKGSAAKLVGGNSSRYLHYLYRRALYDSEFVLPVEVKGVEIVAKFVPGHLWGDDTKDFNGGPRRADVMVIGKNPGAEEVSKGRNFVGPSSDVFMQSVQSLGLTMEQLQYWYLTNLVKWPQLDPNSNGTPAAHIRDCAVLLQEEIRLVQPRFILCLGSDASKA